MLNHNATEGNTMNTYSVKFVMLNRFGSWSKSQARVEATSAEDAKRQATARGYRVTSVETV